MGIADRDYERAERRGSSDFFAQLTPVVKWLLILNLGIYFLDVMMESADGAKPFRQFGAFSIHSAVTEMKVWEFITFQFFHGSMAHVFFNCLGLFFFGPWMERWWGAKKFLTFYLLCGVAGAAFFSLLIFLRLLPADSIYSQLVGASAGLYGVLIGVAMIAPNLRVTLLLPPIELSIRQLALGLLGIAVGMVILGSMGVSLFGLVSNEGGEAGHLGGAILGFVLVRYPWILGSGVREEIVRPKASAPKPLPKLRPRSELEKNQDDAVDKILDKISRDGFQSLTQEEREFLQKASQSKQPTK